MYALQTVPVDVHGTTGCTLLFEYPLGNTWTYKTLFGPLCKNHRAYARIAGRQFDKELVVDFPNK
jgi:hypothetical protein